MVLWLTRGRESDGCGVVRLLRLGWSVASGKVHPELGWHRRC